jgi:hypothetical protein
MTVALARGGVPDVRVYFDTMAALVDVLLGWFD